MKIASSFSQTLDDLKSNTYAVKQLHGQMVDEVYNEESESQAVKDKIEELF